MRRLARFLGYIFFAIVLLPVVDKALMGQQGKPAALHSIQTDNPVRLNPSLNWISEYSPPFIYQLWWAEIAECEGLPLPLEKIRKVQFFQVNAPDFIPQDVDAVVYAITYGVEEQIYIAYPYIWNRAVTKHEILHLLLKWAGDPNWYRHDPKRFMSCGLRIGGTPPPNE